MTKLGSVGRPCLYVELDIWDEPREARSRREHGEVVLRGPKIFKGYAQTQKQPPPPSLAAAFHTGDIGVRDDDGYLFIVDRLKDMILSGGENIAGSEVGHVLYEH